MLSFDLFDTKDDAFFDTPLEEAQQQHNFAPIVSECTEEVHKLDTPMPSPHGSFVNSPLDFMAATHNDKDTLLVEEAAAGED